MDKMGNLNLVEDVKIIKIRKGVVTNTIIQQKNSILYIIV
jgi:hypothetical protein